MTKGFDFLCLGSSDCYPKAGNDSSCYLIDGHILVDVGHSILGNLLAAGADITKIDTVIFTHTHFDHYSGFTQLLSYIHFQGIHSPEGPCPLAERLTVIGPEETLEKILKPSVEYFLLGEVGEWCEPERVGIPKAVYLPERGSITFGEYTLSFIPSLHAVPGRCYRLQNAAGHSVGFSGDTTPTEELVPFFQGVDTLIYENSFAMTDIEPRHYPGHSSAHDAGRIAAAAHAGRLILTHSRNDDHAAAVEVAARYYNGPISYPVTGTVDVI